MYLCFFRGLLLHASQTRKEAKKKKKQEPMMLMHV